MKWSRLESPGYYFFLLLSSERSKLLEFSALYPLPFPTNTTISTLTEQGKSSSELAPLWVGPAVRFWLETGAKPSPPQPAVAVITDSVGNNLNWKCYWQRVLSIPTFSSPLSSGLDIAKTQPLTTRQTTGPKLKPLLRPQLGGGCFFFFTPIWGRWTHFDEHMQHMFQMG